MIPTAERLRSNRRWSAALGGAVGGAIALVGATFAGGTAVLAVVLAAAGAVALLTYRFGTRVWRRRRRVVARAFPPDWEDILTRRVAYYAGLGLEAKQRFRALAAVFLDETPIFGAGCEVDDTTRLLVAASAVIPILGFDAWEYGMLHDVVIRPGPFELREPQEDDELPDTMLGMVGGHGGAFTGTMVLSKRQLEQSYTRDRRKFNVGIHEFAHLIDQGDGAIDGVPPGLNRQAYRSWWHLVSRLLEKAGEEWSDIPEYGFTNEQEFFAVASECFFQAPHELAERHGELYALLVGIFRQDPRDVLVELGPRVGRRRRPDRPAGP